MTSTLPAGKKKITRSFQKTTLHQFPELIGATPKERRIHYIGMIRRNRVKDCTMTDEKELKKKKRKRVNGLWIR